MLEPLFWYAADRAAASWACIVWFEVAAAVSWAYGLLRAFAATAARLLIYAGEKEPPIGHNAVQYHEIRCNGLH